MGLLDTVRAGVAIANNLMRPLQAEVTYERYLGDNGYGSKDFAPPVKMHAIVDFTSKQVRTPNGELTVTRATIDLLDISEVVSATNGEGIGNNDKFTLPDGDTGPTLDIAGFIDAGTGHPIATTVMIG